VNPPPVASGVKCVTDACPSARTADFTKTGLPVSSPRGWSTVTAAVSSPVKIAK
jgi:hypothetical protein